LQSNSKNSYWFSLNTPKALANFSPGFELARTLGSEIRDGLTLQGFVPEETLSGLSALLCSVPGLSRCSNPGLKLANAFGVFKLNQYQFQTEPVPKNW